MRAAPGGQVAAVRDRLSTALKQTRADYAEVRMERSRSSRVVFRGRRLELAEESVDAGGCVRVLSRGCGWGVASFTTLDDLPKMLDAAGEMSRAIVLAEPIRLAETAPREDEVVPELDGDPLGVPLAEKRRLLEHLNGLMLAASDKIADTAATYSDERTEWYYANSEGTWLYELRPEIGLAAQATARDGGCIERSLESVGLRRGWRSVQDRDEMFRAAARRALELLDAPAVVGGTYPVVLDPRLAGVFVHEAFGHLSEADFVYENPQAREMMTLGRRFGSDIVTIGDDGSAPGLRGTLPYDDEGTPTQRTVLVREGMLVGRLHSRETAAAMGEHPTGNARAISFRHPPIVRMTNTYLEAGSGGLDDLIADIRLGVYAVDAVGGQTFLENFSFSAARGYMIRNGRLAELVKDVVLAGNLFQSLQSIDGVAGDFRWNQTGGGCGKGGQVPLPVTEGAPHVRFRELLVGGEVGG
ncbi:MAG: TldD/PmbA family protein [Gemmatimonadetes bacterium]|nr:TldD/PmbA family protein [Gemmatimonadota bacterium]